MLKEMPFDDPLVDIDIKDIVDIVRVYSAFSKNQERGDSLFVPKLFQEEPEEVVPSANQKEDNQVQLFEQSILEIPTNLKDLSRVILQSLPEIIKKKEE